MSATRTAPHYISTTGDLATHLKLVNITILNLTEEQGMEPAKITTEWIDRVEAPDTWLTIVEWPVEIKEGR